VSVRETLTWRVEYMLGAKASDPTAYWMRGPNFGSCEGAMAWIAGGKFDTDVVHTRIIRVCETEWRT
jgi:hypothetical protein